MCAICGKPIHSNSTIDHVIPQAIYKWHEQYLERSEFMALRRRITSPRNTVRTHRHCNERKEEAIVSLDDLHVSRAKRGKLRQTFRDVEPYIEAFLSRKAELLERQQGRCFVCRAPLGESGVLRRIDDTADRIWDNACLICHRCNCRVKSGDVQTYRARRLSSRKNPRLTKAGVGTVRPKAAQEPPRTAPPEARLPKEPPKPPQTPPVPPAQSAPKKRRRRRRRSAIPPAATAERPGENNGTT